MSTESNTPAPVPATVAARRARAEPRPCGLEEVLSISNALLLLPILKTVAADGTIDQDVLERYCSGMATIATTLHDQLKHERVGPIRALTVRSRPRGVSGTNLPMPSAAELRELALWLRVSRGFPLRETGQPFRKINGTLIGSKDGVQLYANTAQLKVHYEIYAREFHCGQEFNMNFKGDALSRALSRTKKRDIVTLSVLDDLSQLRVSKAGKNNGVPEPSRGVLFESVELFSGDVPEDKDDDGIGMLEIKVSPDVLAGICKTVSTRHLATIVICGGQDWMRVYGPDNTVIANIPESPPSATPMYSTSFKAEDFLELVSFCELVRKAPDVGILPGKRTRFSAKIEDVGSFSMSITPSYVRQPTP